MTIYKELTYDKLQHKLIEFGLCNEPRKKCLVNGVRIYYDKIVFEDGRIILLKTHCEAYNTWDDDMDYDYVDEEIAEIECDNESKFILKVDFDWFEIVISWIKCIYIFCNNNITNEWRGYYDER